MKYILIKMGCHCSIFFSVSFLFFFFVLQYFLLRYETLWANGNTLFELLQYMPNAYNSEQLSFCIFSFQNLMHYFTFTYMLVCMCVCIHKLHYNFQVHCIYISNIFNMLKRIKSIFENPIITFTCVTNLVHRILLFCHSLSLYVSSSIWKVSSFDSAVHDMQHQQINQLNSKATYTSEQ